MPERFFATAFPALALFFVLADIPSRTQQPESDSAAPHTTTLASGVDRLAGTEPSSHIQYARLILKGALHGVAKGAADLTPPEAPPILIAQCSLRPNGK